MNNDLFEFKNIDEVALANRVADNDAPFPQANSIPNILKLIKYLKTNEYLTVGICADILQYTSRQGSYYLNALYYLDLIEKDAGGKYKKSSFFSHFTDSESEQEEEYWLIIAILRHEVFYKVYLDYRTCFSVPRKEFILKMMANTELELSDNHSTNKRRCSTVYTWFKWISDTVFLYQ